MTGKSRIAFWTITLIILFGLLMAIGYMMINEYNEEIVYHNLTPEGYDLIEQKVDLDTNLLLTKKDGKYGIIDINGRVIENNKYDFEDIIFGYDGYYIVNEENKTLIKRNGKLVDDVTNINEKYKLIKDDSDGPYIIYVTENNEFANNKIDEDIYVANIIEGEDYTSLILDTKEGILKEIKGFVSKIKRGNEDLNKYLINVIGDKVQLLSIYNYEVILDGYTRIGDEENIPGYYYGGSINNDNYITVCDYDKCGITNTNNELIIPIQYEEIKKVEQIDPLYISVKENNKYGIINLKNEYVVSPIYDEVFSYNNTFILIKDNKLIITDNKLNKQYETDVNLDNEDINCTIYNDSYIKISINEASNAGVPRKILIVDKDNTIKEYKYDEFVDVIDLDNKMSEDLYAIYSKKNNEVYIDVYEGLSIKESFMLIQINEISDIYMDAISNNEIMLKMKTNNGDYYSILNIGTGNIVINDALKKYNIKNANSQGFVVDIEDSNLVYYKSNLISETLEENVINAIKLNENVYIIKKIDNTVYLYRINKR